MRKPILSSSVIRILGAVLALAPACVLAQEGYDPMLQILHQFAHPIVVIIQDTSGSMAYDKYGNTVGVDTKGNAPTGAWSQTHSSCSGSNCKQWVYSLTITQTLPSRMCVLKNAMGNSVDIWLEWAPPASYTWPNITWTGYSSVTGPALAINQGATPVTYKYSWTVKYGSYHADPGQPFALTISNFINAGTGGTNQAPADLIGANANIVNWGLETFGGTTCGTYGMTVNVNSDDNNQAATVTALENKMMLSSAGGLAANSSTPTKAAVSSALAALSNVYNNDPKRNCGRAYGTILVTDGLSNYCNPNNGNWISPCGACPGPTCCDGGSSGYNCPNNYTSFAAGAAESLWNLTLGGKRLNVRTWVVGVSNAVGPCELNYTAYMGRTDSEAGDAGFNTSADPYLPTSTGDGTHYTINATHPNYAYFATDSQALIDAFAAIVAAVATGDYTTSSPVGTSSSSGSYGILASTEFPGWKGHLYKYDVSTPSCHSATTSGTCASPCYWDSSTGTCTWDPPLVWDAGALMNSSPVGTDATNGRKIYTWNPSNSNALVEVKASNQATLNTLCGGCGINAAVIDFIRGNNGAGAARPWKLGPIINATPAIVGTPLQFTLPGVKGHSIFESTYAARTQLIWVGADDGMLHAFRFDNGAEALALIPPNLLAIQPQLYSFYDANKSPTGQKKMPSDQVYGVAGSIRYGDVYFGPPVNDYKTVAYLTEGPGGDLLAAIDITHPTSGDPNYSSASPVSILWTKTGTTLSGLKKTWSTPAGGLTTAGGLNGPDLWSLEFGAGYNSASTQSAQVAPSVFVLDAATGTASTFALTNLATPSPWVGNQTFADAVIYSKTTHGYYPDSVVDLAVQPDLNGRLWFLSKTAAPTWTPNIGVNVSNKTTPIKLPTAQQQPIYYSPAVSGYNTYDIYAFASGTFYEKSQNVTGINIGQSGYFIPCLYVVVKPQDAAQATNAQIVQIPLPNLTFTYTDNTQTPPVSITYTLGRRTQVTASPLMTIPAVGLAGKPQVLFEVYDPDTTDCAGTSYIVQVEVTVGPTPTGSVAEMTMAGSGAGSGFAIIGESAFVAKSGVGQGETAQMHVVPHVNPTQGMGNTSPVWWRQLQ